MRVFSPAMVLIAASLSVHSQTAPAVPANGNVAGAGTPTPAMSTYRSDLLHLSYSYPATYVDASSTVGPALQASIGKADFGPKDEMRCVTLPFSAMDTASGKFGMVLLARADAGCMKKRLTPAELPVFTKGEVQGLAASGARTQFDEPVSFTDQGHAAELLRGTFELPTGQALHALVVCMLLKPDIACWQFLASSDDALRAMAAFPLTLEGGTPAPLVPTSALAKP